MQKLKADAGAPAIQAPAFALLKAGLEMALAAASAADEQELWDAARKADRALKRAFTTLERSAR